MTYEFRILWRRRQRRRLLAAGSSSRYNFGAASHRQQHIRMHLVLLTYLASLAVALPAPPASVQLVVDHAAVASRSGVAIVFGAVKKAEANPLIAEDQPWEAANRNTYPTATWDASDQKYKVWYSEPEHFPICRAYNTSSPASGH